MPAAIAARSAAAICATLSSAVCTGRTPPVKRRLLAFRRNSSSPTVLLQRRLPAIAPTTLVTAMASALQNATRRAPVRISAPPTLADQPPRISKQSSDAATMQTIRKRCGANAVTSRGKKGAARKTTGRGQRGLQRARAGDRGKPQFIAGMRAQCVVRHELRGHLRGKLRVEPAAHVDLGQFAALAGEVDLEFGTLLRQRGGFGVRLRMTRKHTLPWPSTWRRRRGRRYRSAGYRPGWRARRQRPGSSSKSIRCRHWRPIRWPVASLLRPNCGAHDCVGA